MNKRNIEILIDLLDIEIESLDGSIEVAKLRLIQTDLERDLKYADRP